MTAGWTEEGAKREYPYVEARFVRREDDHVIILGPPAAGTGNPLPRLRENSHDRPLALDLLVPSSVAASMPKAVLRARTPAATERSANTVGMRN